MADEISPREARILSGIIPIKAIPVIDFHIDDLKPTVWDDEQEPNGEDERRPGRMYKPDPYHVPRPTEQPTIKENIDYANLTKGKYRIKWESSKILDKREITNTKTFISVDGIEKQIAVDSIKIDGNSVISEINILQNPIPLLMVGYAILGIAGLTAGTFFVSEVNELADNTGNLLIIGGVILVIINYKKIKGMF